MLHKINILILLVFALSCNAQQNRTVSNQSKAMALNNRAMSMILDNRNNIDSLVASLKLFDEAIKIDKTLSAPYANKARVLCMLGQMEEAISTLKNFLIITDSVPELKAFTGFMYEKSGEISMAREFYNSAIADYDKYLINNPNSLRHEINRAFLFFFVSDGEQARQEYKQLKERNPTSYEVIVMEDMFLDFDKTDFLQSLCD